MRRLALIFVVVIGLAGAANAQVSNAPLTTNTVITTTGPVSTTPQAHTYSSSTATFNAASGNEATLTISANVTITLSGCTAGQHLFLKLVYTGSFTPTFAVGGSDTLNFNANGAPTFTAANSKTDIIGFDCQSNGSGIAYDALPASLGYAG